jgi:hypothetical protein
MTKMEALRSELRGALYNYSPMQACLVWNKAKVTPACRKIVDRLEKGEKVRVFGG